MFLSYFKCRSNNINITDPPDPVKVVSDFKKAEELELKLIRNLRQTNGTKTQNIPLESNTDSTNKVSIFLRRV